ncbi:MAG: hypothetical protein MRY78_09735 [Saprospiraceae bacterium]|nr:hypothetical protein [Saprospiraceae bacterium]
MSLKTRLLPIAFILVLVLHFADELFVLLPEQQLAGRQGITERPYLNINHLDPFSKEYEAYYNDQFKWRSYFLQFNNWLNIHTFDKMVLPGKVVIGKDDWLFRGGHQMEVYRGIFQLSPNELEATIQEIKQRQQKAEAAGSRFYLTIAPLKAHVYKAQLPDNLHQLIPESYTQQLVQAMRKEGINYIDLFTPLETAAKDRLMYLKTDHHWNNQAALLASEVILDTLRQAFPRIPAFNSWSWDLQAIPRKGMSQAQMLGLADSFQDTVFEISSPAMEKVTFLKDDYTAPKGFPFPEEYVIQTHQNHPDLPSIMLVRESFANPMVEILPPFFEETTFVFDNWEHHFNEPIFEDTQPDIYLHILWEGLLFRLIRPEKKQIDW